jgi:hypothetical protein
MRFAIRQKRATIQSAKGHKIQRLIRKDPKKARRFAFYHSFSLNHEDRLLQILFAASDGGPYRESSLRGVVTASSTVH